MMMAYDSSQGPHTLADETIAAVRSALVSYIGAPGDGTRVRSALRVMADEARAKSMPAEQLLIVLKDIWYSLPAVRAMTDVTQQVRLLQRIVTMCIKEYYSQAD
jgi:hypothetical protein